MAADAGVGYSGAFTLARSDKAEGMRADVVVFDRLLDLGHVACRALTSGAPFGVVGVLGDRGFKASWVVGVMALKAEKVSDPAHTCDVGGAVDLMAVEAANLAVVHIALDEVVALHAVLVRGQVGVLKEVRDSGL